jgi:hypothetical protein
LKKDGLPFIKERIMKKVTTLMLSCIMIAACSLPVDAPPPHTALPSATTQPAGIPSQTFTPISALTQTPVPTQTSAPTIAPAFCNDPRTRALITSFGAAVTTSNGELLASLVSPAQGMDVLFYRDGKVINYDVEHAKFVFETTYQADWGLSFGSGEPTIGAFKDIVLPSLKVVFTPNAELVCNQIKTGGATYQPEWPYPYMDFYSVHFPGTEEYGDLDWQTWAVGMDNVGGKPYVAALVHFVWEP